MDIYAYVNKHHAVQHWIDIDHFVPQSVNGPGNIIENLVPIGLSINRYKSNDIPRGLFEEAHKRDLSGLFNSSYLKGNDFISSKDGPAYLQEATAIVNHVNEKHSIEKVRSFYKEVLKRHFPHYVDVIEQFNKTY